MKEVEGAIEYLRGKSIELNVPKTPKEVIALVRSNPSSIKEPLEINPKKKMVIEYFYDLVKKGKGFSPQDVNKKIDETSANLNKNGTPCEGSAKFTIWKVFDLALKKIFENKMDEIEKNHEIIVKYIKSELKIEKYNSKKPKRVDWSNFTWLNLSPKRDTYGVNLWIKPDNFEVCLKKGNQREESRKSCSSFAEAVDHLKTLKPELENRNEELRKKDPSKKKSRRRTKADEEGTGEESPTNDKGDNDTQPKNQILYGPPGTGKTYCAKRLAVEICTGKKYNKNNENNEYKEIQKKFQELKKEGRIGMVVFHQSYGYEDFIEGLRPEVDEEIKQLKYDVKPGAFKEFCQKAKGEGETPYVFIIDEINRGNISKIFGELISCIEENKRLGEPEELTVKLPFSKDDFGVPNNVYIIGTMNTADKSISIMDMALRRRFQFEEMMPDAGLLKLEKKFAGSSLSDILKKLNERIALVVGRDYQIGHSYFMKVEGLSDLKGVFRYQIIPLLNECCYEEWGKIEYILGGGFVGKIQKNSKKLQDLNYYEDGVYNFKDVSSDGAFKTALEELMKDSQKNDNQDGSNSE